MNCISLNYIIAAKQNQQEDEKIYLKRNRIFISTCFRNVAEKLFCFLNSTVLAACCLLRSIVPPRTGRPSTPAPLLARSFFFFFF